MGSIAAGKRCSHNSFITEVARVIGHLMAVLKACVTIWQWSCGFFKSFINQFPNKFAIEHGFLPSFPRVISRCDFFFDDFVR